MIARKHNGPMAWAACLSLGVFVLCSIAGCSPGNLASVSGKVTYDGTPIENGTIQFTPTGETPGTRVAAKITGGSYQIPSSEDLYAGTYTVMIMATRPATPEEVARMPRDELAEEPQMGDDEEGEGEQVVKAQPVVQYIPPKYNESSKLTVELASGENTNKDFALEK